jgi:CRP/FNR family cyclic AMP-dependent transcriptional regulator
LSKKVLLIEDDKIVRENTSEILELANFIVKTAENGKKGVSLAKTFLPDIIICDVLMPELDGYGVLQIISNSPELDHIPFIFLSAKTDHEDLRKGMELGADDYISKPFEESELLRAIESRLKKAKTFDQKLQTQLSIDFIEQESNSIQIKNFEQFLSKKNIYSYNSGETIYCHGNQSNHIFLIKKGFVKTFKINEQGKELITGFFKDQEYFGYTAFVKHLPHFENSKAITTTHLYKISKNEISAIINNNHHIIYKFIDLLAGNLIDLNEKMIVQAYGSVRKKTAFTLLSLLNEYPIKPNNEIQISRSNLANLIGIAKETLTRTLHDFKEEDLIEITPKSIIILNSSTLQKIQ